MTLTKDNNITTGKIYQVRNLFVLDVNISTFSSIVCFDMISLLCFVSVCP